jgi:hypothetical protein
VGKFHDVRLDDLVMKSSGQREKVHRFSMLPKKDCL